MIKKTQKASEFTPKKIKLRKIVSKTRLQPYFAQFRSGGDQVFVLSGARIDGHFPAKINKPFLSPGLRGATLLREP
jgi:hypothetical protein